MKYLTLNDLSNTIRKNIWKIPRDIDLVVGIPRSGMLPATIISEFLNIPLIDINSFVKGELSGGGGRLRYFKKKDVKKILVVDDTVFQGGSKVEAKKKLQGVNESYEYVFLVAYLEGPGEKYVDIYLEDVRPYTNGFSEPVLYEWNIFHHNEAIMQSCIYDMDGVLCVNPPDERNEEEYVNYIKNAIPLFIPSTKIGAICTYRLLSRQNITVEWLKKWGIEYNNLIMVNGDYNSRARTFSSQEYKASYYKSQSWAKLFIESDDVQARDISILSGKPCFSVEGNRLYNNGNIA